MEKIEKIFKNRLDSMKTLDFILKNEQWNLFTEVYNFAHKRMNKFYIESVVKIDSEYLFVTLETKRKLKVHYNQIFIENKKETLKYERKEFLSR